MALFSSIKRMHKHSKEHSSKSSERSRDEKPAPYRHTPTHAASDSISGTPGGFGNKDRHKIREENRKRSAMAAAHAHAHHMSMPGVPQGGSGMSSAVYASGEVTPAVSTPDAYGHHDSYGHPDPYGHSASSSIYTVFSEVDYNAPRTRKGKEVDRGNYFDLTPLRPSTNKGGYTPDQSLRNSMGSQDGVRLRKNPSTAERPTTIIGDVPHRLHPSSRRASDASEKLAIPKSTKNGNSNPAVLRDTRPPPSIRKFMAVPQIPPLHFSGHQRNVDSPVFNTNPGVQSSPQLTSRRNSSHNSLPSLTHASSRVSSTTPSTPTRTIRVKKAEFTMLTPEPRVPSGEFDFQFKEDRRMKRRSTHDGDTRRYGQHFMDTNMDQLNFDLPPTPQPQVSRRPHSMNPSPRESKRESKHKSDSKSKSDSKHKSKSRSRSKSRSELPSPPPSPKHRHRRFSLSRAGSKLLNKRWSSGSKK